MREDNHEAMPTALAALQRDSRWIHWGLRYVLALLLAMFLSLGWAIR